MELATKILNLWQRLEPLPAGKWLFSCILGFNIPYTGTMGARIKILRPGYTQIELPDRRKVRNHLNCIHAIALMNLGELTTGLSLMTGLKPGIRGIITGLSIEYFKKARGRLTAIAETDLPDVKDDLEYQVIAEIKDQAGDVVARCTANWRLGIKP